MTDGAHARLALLVEDEALVAMIAEEFLDGQGFKVVTATSGAEARAIFRDRTDIDLAMLDIGLPDQRGDDLARELRALRPNLPIIMVSGYDGAQIKAGFPDDRLLGVLSKPYGEADMIRAIAALGL